jgi:hypothetical protein
MTTLDQNIVALIHRLASSPLQSDFERLHDVAEANPAEYRFASDQMFLAWAEDSGARFEIDEDHGAEEYLI